MRKIVGRITAYGHRGRVRLVVVANTGETLAIDLNADAAWEFAWQLCEIVTT